MRPFRLIAAAVIACSLSFAARPQAVPPPGGGGGGPADPPTALVLFVDGGGRTFYGSLNADGSLTVEVASSSGDPMVEGGVTVTDTAMTYYGEVDGELSAGLTFVGTASDGSGVTATFRLDGTSTLSDASGTLNELAQSELGL